MLSFTPSQKRFKCKHREYGGRLVGRPRFFSIFFEFVFEVSTHYWKYNAADTLKKIITSEFKISVLATWRSKTSRAAVCARSHAIGGLVIVSEHTFVKRLELTRFHGETRVNGGEFVLKQERSFPRRRRIVPRDSRSVISSHLQKKKKRANVRWKHSNPLFLEHKSVVHVAHQLTNSLHFDS